VYSKGWFGPMIGESKLLVDDVTVCITVSVFNHLIVTLPPYAPSCKLTDGGLNGFGVPGLEAPGTIIMIGGGGGWNT